MVYVTHDQEEALTLGDRVVLLDGGVIRQADTPQALYERPANRLAAAFIGWPPMNFLEGRLVEVEGRLVEVEGRLTLTGGEATLSLAERQDEWRPFVGREVALGIRPEHVRVIGRAGGVSPLILHAVADVVLNQGANAPRSPGLAEVRLVERAGSYRLATLDYGGWTVTARLEGSLPVSEGERVAVEFALVQAHLFDRQTGRLLSSGRPEGGRR